jgi:hypothetical protein
MSSIHRFDLDNNVERFALLAHPTRQLSKVISQKSSYSEANYTKSQTKLVDSKDHLPFSNPSS